jgi:hypothetical protein
MRPKDAVIRENLHRTQLANLRVVSDEVNVDAYPITYRATQLVQVVRSGWVLSFFSGGWASHAEFDFNAYRAIEFDYAAKACPLFIDCERDCGTPSVKGFLVRRNHSATPNVLHRTLPNGQTFNAETNRLHALNVSRRSIPRADTKWTPRGQ